MNTKIKQAIIELSKSNPTEEICGFIQFENGKPYIFPCKNVAEKKGEEFEINSDDQILAMYHGRTLGVYHSHPNGNAFSPADIEHSEELCLPYYLYVVEDNDWHEYIPSTYKMELEGMAFVWGFQDCYGLVRTYYREVQKLYLKDYDRDENFGDNNNDIILKNFNNEGFEIILDINNLKIGDSLLFKTSRLLPQHLAIYVGNSKILHHPQNALSHIDMFSDRWIDRVFHILRYNPALKSCNNSIREGAI